MVFDIDGTREAARQRALPQTDELPPPFRRLGDVCAPGYRGRRRGEVVRTRTTVSQAHSCQWLGTFGNRGNGRYREELRKGLSAIGRYLTIHHLPQGGHASCRKEEESGRRHTCAHSSTNCSSRTCRNTPSPPAMWSSCICIAEPYGS